MFIPCRNGQAGHERIPATSPPGPVEPWRFPHPSPWGCGKRHGSTGGPGWVILGAAASNGNLPVEDARNRIQDETGYKIRNRTEAEFCPVSYLVSGLGFAGSVVPGR